MNRLPIYNAAEALVYAYNALLDAYDVAERKTIAAFEIHAPGILAMLDAMDIATYETRDGYLAIIS